jgi:hypothetical protein
MGVVICTFHPSAILDCHNALTRSDGKNISVPEMHGLRPVQRAFSNCASAQHRRALLQSRDAFVAPWRICHKAA